MLRALDLSDGFPPERLGRRGWRAIETALRSATRLEALTLCALSDGLEGAFAVPPGLRKLSLRGSALVSALLLPAHSQLRELDVTMCAQLAELPSPLPRQLRSLRAAVAPAGLSVPETLEVLCLDRVPLTRRDVDQLLSGAPRLAELSLVNCGLEGLGRLPKSLRRLSVPQNAGLVLPPLPASLTALHASTCDLARVDVELPAGLRELALSGNPGLRVPDPLPPRLEALTLSFIELAAELPLLPSTLLSLRVGGNHGICLWELPPSLTQLDVRDCALAALPSPLPGTLRQLHLDDNRGLAFPDLDGLSRLEVLDAQACRFARAPGRFPPSLTQLRLWGNADIELPPDCFEGLAALTSLKLGSCNLQRPPRSIRGLAAVREIDFSFNQRLVGCADVLAGLPALETVRMQFVGSEEVERVRGAVSGKVEVLGL